MSVENITAASGPYVADGVTTVFPFSFSALSAAEVAVSLNGVQVTTGFTVSVLPNGTGTVTFAVAPVAGSLDIYSNPSFAQEVVLQRFGPYYPDTLNAPLDRAAKVSIYLRNKIDKLFPSLGVSSVARAGKFLGWDGAGTPTLLSGTGADAALRSDLASGAAGASLVNFTPLRSSTPSASTVAAKLATIPNVCDPDFGVVLDGSTNNDVALAKVKTFLALRSASGFNTVKMNWPAGRLIYSVMPNWAINHLHMDFDGECWLINTGTGNSFTIDGGATGAGVRALRITGAPKIFGPAGSLHGVYMRAVQRSTLELSVQGAGSTSSGFLMEWCVSNNCLFKVDFNDGGLYNTPARGLTLTQRSVSEQTSYNAFHNIELSGLPIGLYADAALGNKFIGGAIQANTKGAELTVNSWTNKFFGTDFEVNTVDAEIAGKSNLFVGCDFETGPVVKSGSLRAAIIGGETRNLTVEAGATATLFEGVSYNRFASPSGTISDVGTKTTFSSLFNMQTLEVHDAPRVRTALTVGASPYTYTNTSGNDQLILVNGGTVSLLALTRFAGDAMPTSGQYTLAPGDSITVIYTVAPAMVRWT